MNSLRVWKRLLIWLSVCTLVLSVVLGALARVPVAGASQKTASAAHVAPRRAQPFPTKQHRVSFTSYKYYAGAHPRQTRLLPLAQKPKPQQHGREKAQSAPGRVGSPLAGAQQTPYTATDYFSFSFYSSGSTDATYGIPITVCVTADDDGAAYGEVVYLTADSGSSMVPNAVTLDTSGCGQSTLYTPTTGTVNVYGGINYISPAFNAWGGYDEYGEYPLPSIGSAPATVTTASIAIPPNTGFGPNGNDPFAAEPVNTALGNYTYQHTDVSLPAHGQNITMTRSYNSQDSSAGPLGIGWTYPYNQALSITSASGSTTASIRYGDGHIENYTLNGSTWTPAPNLLVLATLTSNSDGTYTVTHKDQSWDQYDANGRLIAMTDRNGNRLTFSYDGSGNLIAVADANGGRGLAFGYDANGHIVAVTDPLGLTTNYQYDSSNHLITVTDPAGDSTHYTYDSANRLLTITDPDGNVPVSNTYDASGRVTQQVNAAGAVTTFTYNTGQTVVTDPLGHTTTYAYDFFYHLVSETDANGNITDYTYDGNGEVTSVTDRDGNTTLYSLDSAGNMTSIEDAIGVAAGNGNGHTVSNTYDSQNHLVSMTDADGNVTSYTYDAHGNLLSVTDAEGGVTTFTYDQYGDKTSSTSPLGGRNTTVNGFDAFGDQISTRDGLGNVTTTTYDADGRPTSTTDPNGHTATTVYNKAGRPITATDATGASVHYSYDRDGNRVSATNALGQVTKYAYDAVGRLVKVTYPDGSTAQYVYDAAGNVTQQTDAKGHITTYTYDNDDRLLSVTDPLGNKTAYTYDAADNIATKTDANGNTTAYGYDANNRMVQINFAGGASTVYGYDGVGNRLSMTDSTGTTTYTYDVLNRLTGVTDPSGRTLNYGYDAASNRTRLTYPDGRSVTYQYDVAGHLVSATDWAAHTTTYTYDAAGNVTSMRLPNGITTTYTYDVDNRLIGVTNTGTSGVISSFQYTRDAAGQRTAVTASGSNVEAGTTSYTYDAMGRLTGVTYPDSSTVSYTYDRAGNRTKMVKVVGGVSTSTGYSYNAADELLKAGSTTYTYDADGNAVSSTKGTSVTNYVYNTAGELASVTKGGTTVAYTYNGDNARVAKSVTTSTGTTTTQYVLTPTQLPQVAEEITSSATTDDLYGLALIGSASLSSTAKPTYFQYDGLGSVRNVTSSGGAVLSTISYDAFGAIRSSAGAKPEFQFDGQQVDPEDGLTNLRSRYYDPSIGRFLSRDPDPGSPDVPGTLNRYAFSNNNPINLADPAGNWFGLDDVIATVGGAIVGGGASIISQAISGNGINWGQVAFDAGVGAVAGEATLYTGPVGTVAVLGAAGAVQGAGDYCFSACGKSDFSWGNLAVDATLGAGTGILFGSLKLGEASDQALGEGLFNLGQNTEDAEAQRFLYDTSGYLTGGKLPSWFPGSTDQWNELLGSLPESVIEGLEGGIQERLHVGDNTVEFIKWLTEHAGAK